MRLIRQLALLLATAAAAPWVQAVCSELESPGLLMGGKAGEPLCQWFDGSAVLVVNTASQCGFTPQFKGLEALHQKYAKQGLRVLGFPSDDFGGQEYADAEATAKVCFINYGVSFPMFRQVDVIGDGAHPLFSRLAKLTQPPHWNFHKYLVTREGVQAFPSSVAPDSPEIKEAIERALKR